MQTRPIIALVGRPNVGKSTLFNRLLGRREAITNFEAGTTRDRHFGVTEWYGHSWTIVDTAGILFEDEQNLERKALQRAMEEQVAVAMEEATVIAVIVDAKEGPTAEDKKLVELLRKQNKPIVLLVNKADNHEQRLNAKIFQQFGIEHIFPVSAIHGTGMSDFVDYLIKTAPYPEQQEKTDLPRVTIIGRPNVGKSTFINQIIGEKRVVVSETPGTTRDSIEVEAIMPSGEKFMLIDTAGIRRRGKIEIGIEKFSLFRTLRAINHSDIVIIMLTIEESPTRGDAHVATYAIEAKKEVIILLNKADLARDPILSWNKHKQHNLGQRFLKRFPFLQRLPYYFVSAQTGEGITEFLSELSNTIIALRKRKS